MGFFLIKFKSVRSFIEFSPIISVITLNGIWILTGSHNDFGGFDN